jgi:hypothetical protein
MEAVKAPVALAAPLFFMLSEIVGVPDVFQQTPWAVGLGLPRSVMFPLPVAVVVEMLVAARVVTVGVLSVP